MNTIIPANIKLAAILSDRLFAAGLISQHTAQQLFDTLSDSLQAETPVCQVVCNEIEFAIEAYTSGRFDSIEEYGT